MATSKQSNPQGNIAHGQNDTRLSDLMAEVQGYGQDAGKGDASIIAMAWATFNGAVDGAVSIEKPEAGPDDAAKIYSAFAAGRATNSPDVPMDEKSLKAQVSKLRAIVKVGVIPAVRKAAIQWREDFQQAWMECGKPGIYGALIKVARAQSTATREDQAAVLDREAMMDAIAGEGKAPKGLVEKLEAQRKALAKLNDGTEAEPGPNSPHIAAALAEIDKALAELLAAEGEAEAAKEKQAALAKMSKAELEAYLATLDTDIAA